MVEKPLPPVLHVLRLTLEAKTPLSPGAGGQSLYDVELVRDAYGLPCVLGSSLAGVLRRLFRDLGRDDNALFGWAGDADQGASARLLVGFGCVHDSKNAAVTALPPSNDDGVFQDELLRRLQDEAPLARHHVRLDHRHVADQRGKFQRVAVPEGTRFSFELTLWGHEEDRAADKATLLELVALIRHPLFRLGGAGRRGYGKVELIACGYAVQHATNTDALRRHGEQRPSDIVAAGLEDAVPSLSTIQPPNAVIAKLHLEPIGFWRVGAGGTPLRLNRFELDLTTLPSPLSENELPDPRSAPADALPLREPWIEWNGDSGAWKDPPDEEITRFVVPGASVKGALRHRAAFHWRRMHGQWEDTQREEPIELEALFGSAKERAETGSGGRASRLWIDDALAEPARVMALDHNSIDRFTGGVRSRVLFSEEVAFRGRMEITIIIAEPREGDGWDEDRRAALCAALADLCDGRLALGAKSMGYCTCKELSWSPNDTEWRKAFEQARESASEQRVVLRFVAEAAT